jgi:hypothetical protein
MEQDEIEWEQLEIEGRFYLFYCLDISLWNGTKLSLICLANEHNKYG